MPSDIADEKLHRAAKIVATYRKSLSLSPLPVTNFDEIWNQCTYCTCADIIVMFETHSIGQTPSEFARTLSCARIANSEVEQQENLHCARAATAYRL